MVAIWVGSCEKLIDNPQDTEQNKTIWDIFSRWWYIQAKYMKNVGLLTKNYILLQSAAGNTI